MFSRHAQDGRKSFSSYTCAAEAEACILQPGQPQAATLTRDNNPFGRQDQAWFAFDVVGQSDTGANQQITLFGEAPADPSFKTTLQQFADPTEPEPGPFVDGVRTSFVGPMSEGATGYLATTPPLRRLPRARRERDRLRRHQGPAHLELRRRQLPHGLFLVEKRLNEPVK